MMIKTLLLALFLVSCGQQETSNNSDRDPSSGGQVTTVQTVLLTEVDPINNLVEITNSTNSTVDISGYWFCSRLSYERVTSSTLVSGSLNLASGQKAVFRTLLDIDDTSADFALYDRGAAFGNPEAMIDFIQFGGTGIGRESVAVAKEIWGAGDSLVLPVGSNFGFSRQDNFNGVGAWSQAMKTFGGANVSQMTAGIPVGGGALVVSEVDPINNIIEIYNGTGSSVDLTNYWFCSRITYERVGLSQVISGDLNLADRGYIVLKLNSLNLDATSADLGLYDRGGAFGDPTAMVDFVQYGAGGIGRESVAVSAGLWNAGDFVSTPGSGQSVARSGSGSGLTSYFVEASGYGAAANRN